MNSFKKGISTLHKLGYQGQGIRIGHLDTGIDGAHPAFAGRIAAFRRFGYRGISEEAGPAYDSGRHGTHTAGLMVGQPSLGMAPSATIYSGMVIEEGNIVSRILAGMDWLMDCEVQVVCLSLGIFSQNPVFRTLIEEMSRRDIFVVCPIGNRGAGQASAPGYYPASFTVGAADRNGIVPPFSGSYHRQGATECQKPDLIAPGVNILSAAPGGALEEKTGTSMAAAQIAGLAALLKGAFPNLPNSIIKTALIASCDPLPPHQIHRAAAGMVNPVKAYELLNCWEKAPSRIKDHAVADIGKADWNKFVDPRLEMQLNMTAETDWCEAVFEFESKEAASDLIQLITSGNGNNFDHRNSIKVLKHAPTVICRAPQATITQVMQWPSVCVAGACDINRFV